MLASGRRSGVRLKSSGVDVLLRHPLLSLSFLVAPPAHSIKASTMAISYRPLNVERLEVRLLKIFPVPYDPDGSAIQSSLETASLLDQPDYCALSYCWGTSPLTASIEIDGRPFGVTDSLEAALKQLRRNRQSSLSLWVDFLCINQADKVEKASQVQLMGMHTATYPSIMLV